MARNRTIPADFPRWEALRMVDREARLLFVFLWTIADDAGRLLYKPVEINEALFPHDGDSLYLIEMWLEELQRAELLERYVVDDVTYLRVRQWSKFQKVQHPGKARCPAPVRPAPAAAPEAIAESHEESPSAPTPPASEANPHEDVFLSSESHEESNQSPAPSASEADAHETSPPPQEMARMTAALPIDPKAVFTPEEVLLELKSALADAKSDGSHTARARYVELAGRSAGLWRGHGAPIGRKERAADAAVTTTSPDILLGGRASARHATIR